MGVAVVYKLPAQFVAAHRQLLDAHDWAAKPELKLAEALPNAGFEPRDVLEAVSRGNSVIVRSRHIASMVRVRQHSGRLGATETASAETVVAVLAKRNPGKPT